MDTTDRPKVAIEDQVKEVAREVALRKNVYPGFVARGKMEQSEADDHLTKMQAALETLIFIRENRADFLEFLKAQQAQAR